MARTPSHRFDRPPSPRINARLVNRRAGKTDAGRRSDRSKSGRCSGRGRSRIYCQLDEGAVGLIAHDRARDLIRANIAEWEAAI